LLVVFSIIQLSFGALMAGISKVDGTIPLGAPLAGYNYPPRRTELWPLPYFTNYTTWMNPSVGVWNPTWVRALVLDNGVERFVFVTSDVIAADGTLSKMAYGYAVELGLNATYQNCLFSSSHTHSGPGAISPEFLWQVAPAIDVMVPALQRLMAMSLAKAMILAQNNLQPAKMDIGVGYLVGVTHNRRAGFSPYVSYGTIDPHLGIVRVDKADGTPMATIWNYAIHGICYDSPNLKYSSDVMGAVNDWNEANIGGISMFINGDAGDINPDFGVCCENKPNFSGGPVIGKAVQKTWETLSPSSEVVMSSASTVIQFGETQLNLTLERLDNCTNGGPLDICAFCKFLDCDANIHLNGGWVENAPLFNAFRFVINGKSSVMVSIPGEALVELGWQIRNDTLDMGYDNTLLAGYSNSHLGYFCTPNEYDIGGYESLLTFWGIGTSALIRSGCKIAAQGALSTHGQNTVHLTAAQLNLNNKRIKN